MALLKVSRRDTAPAAASDIRASVCQAPLICRFSLSIFAAIALLLIDRQPLPA